MADRTISQLEAERYVSALITCKKCRNRVGFPFKLMRIENPRLRNRLSAMTLEELAPRLRCSKCGAKEVTVEPHRQEDAQGYAKKF
jgi:hypothetical protein